MPRRTLMPMHTPYSARRCVRLRSQLGKSDLERASVSMRIGGVIGATGPTGPAVTGVTALQRAAATGPSIVTARVTAPAPILTGTVTTAPTQADGLTDHGKDETDLGRANHRETTDDEI